MMGDFRTPKRALSKPRPIKLRLMEKAPYLNLRLLQLVKDNYSFFRIFMVLCNIEDRKRQSVFCLSRSATGE